MLDRDLLIYLDPEFVVRKFEELEKISPATTITKSEDLGTDINFLGLKAGATVRESRTFSVSTWSMLEQIWDSLDTYPKFNETLSLKPRWYEGYLGMGQTTNTREHTHIDFGNKGKREHSKELLGEHWYFELRVSDAISLPLFTKQQYFASGYDQMLVNIHGPSSLIWLQVRMLAKVLFNNKAQDIAVAVPYLIQSIERDG